MSSSTRSRPDPRAVRLAAAVLVLCPALPAGPTAVPLADATVRRVVIRYTGAPDAGGEASGALAARLAAEHVLLVVVSTATDSGYWSGVTRPTGGFLAPAVTSAVTPALDQVATSLRARYLVSFPAPARPP